MEIQVEDFSEKSFSQEQKNLLITYLLKIVTNLQEFQDNQNTADPENQDNEKDKLAQIKESDLESYKYLLDLLNEGKIRNLSELAKTSREMGERVRQNRIGLFNSFLEFLGYTSQSLIVREHIYESKISNLLELEGLVLACQTGEQVFKLMCNLVFQPSVFDPINQVYSRLDSTQKAQFVEFTLKNKDLIFSSQNLEIFWEIPYVLLSDFSITKEEVLELIDKAVNKSNIASSGIQNILQLLIERSLKNDKIIEKIVAILKESLTHNTVFSLETENLLRLLMHEGYAKQAAAIIQPFINLKTIENVSCRDLINNLMKTYEETEFFRQEFDGKITPDHIDNYWFYNILSFFIEKRNQEHLEWVVKNIQNNLTEKTANSERMSYLLKLLIDKDQEDVVVKMLKEYFPKHRKLSRHLYDIIQYKFVEEGKYDKALSILRDNITPENIRDPYLSHIILDLVLTNESLGSKKNFLETFSQGQEIFTAENLSKYPKVDYLLYWIKKP